MCKWRWGVILDAGSSGTRVYIYRWLNIPRARHEAKGTTELNHLPELQTKPEYTKKILPGVSTFADHIMDIGPEHLQDLLDHTLSIIPENQVQDTPIFLMATAGVRLLETTKQKAILDEICSYTKKKTKFSLSNCELHIQVISGETEGLYGWIAANYLLKGFENPSQQTHSQRNRTYGFLDMGGASAQIAFEPSEIETEKHADDLKLLRLRTLNGKMSEYKVFTATWLGSGVNQARERYLASLMDESYTKDAHELLDPCLPSGLKTSIDGEPVGDTHQGTALVGTGLFDECLRKTYPLLDKDAPCADQPCLLNGQHVPAIDWKINQFVGVSEYWYTTYAVFQKLARNEKYDFALYQKLVRDFCSEEWEDIKIKVKEKKWGNDFDMKNAQQLCFKASWLMSVLHDGIGVPRNIPTDITLPTLNEINKPVRHGKDINLTDSFRPINKIGNMEVSWTIGKILLYAAGQIPPFDNQTFPVGFGPNSGEPGSFQEAGSKIDLVPETGREGTWTEAAEELAERAQSRSTHSVLLFVIIFIVIGHIFRKRDRGLRLYRAVRRTRRSSSPHRSSRGFFYTGGKYFGPLSVNYDKVLDEEGVSAKFEFGEAEIDDNEHSDSSGRSRIGRTSGRAASKAKVSGIAP